MTNSQAASLRGLRQSYAWAIGLLTIAPLVLGSCTASSQSVTTPTVVTPSSVTPSPSPSPSSLPVAKTDIWSQLRQGKGYVILLRHALAPGTGDPPDFQLGDCSTQRNLSAEGRQQAIQIGEVLRRQNITVARVLSSQWCRCLETARLMNLGRVEPFPVLNSFFQDRSTEDGQTEQLRQFILDNRDRSGVTVMVTHQVNITAISQIVPQSGAAVVMRATAPDRVEFVGQLDPLKQSK